MTIAFCVLFALLCFAVLCSRIEASIRGCAPACDLLFNVPVGTDPRDLNGRQEHVWLIEKRIRAIRQWRPGSARLTQERRKRSMRLVEQELTKAAFELKPTEVFSHDRA